MAAPISLAVPQLLAEHFGHRKTHEFASDRLANLQDLLDLSAQDYPKLDRRIRDETGAMRRFVNCYLNGEDVRLMQGLDTPIKAGDEVQIIQSVAGG